LCGYGHGSDRRRGAAHEGVDVVGPITEAERDAGNRRIKLVILLIVATSPPLISLQFDPSPLELLAALGAGTALGLVVVWYLSRLGTEFAGSSRRPDRRQ